LTFFYLSILSNVTFDKFWEALFVQLIPTPAISSPLNAAKSVSYEFYGRLQ